MEANLKTLLANVRPEEVELQEVIIHEGSRILHGGTIAVPEGIGTFEYLEVYGSFKSSSGDVYGLPLAKVTPELLLDTYYGDLTMSSRYVSSSDYAYVRTAALFNTPTSITVFADSSTNWLEVGIDKVIGYKRRYSKTSLAEITEAASKPNLFINTWHTGAKVRNQRNFDGNWSALAVGNYGLDMWLKTSATHKGFIVEAGSYKPSAKHTVVADGGGILGTVISPADGGHWLHAFPFASDRFSIREGDIPLGWSPDTEARLDECYRHYEVSSDINFTFKEYGAGAYGDTYIPLMPKRVVPLCTVATVNAGTATLETGKRMLRVYITSTTATAYVSGYTADATIALSEVTDDAEHRVVWG